MLGQHRWREIDNEAVVVAGGALHLVEDTVELARTQLAS